MAMHVTGPIYSGQGNYISIPMAKGPGTYAAASNTTVIAGWRTVLPPFALQLDAVGITFAGAGSAPQGGSFVVKVWSNGARKGLITASVGGATQAALYFGNLAFTFPASALARLSVHTVGGTAAGGGGQPTLYMRHRG